jgi:hypothetical protein
MIELISPAGFDRVFRGVVEMLESGDVDPERGAQLAADYGLSFVETPWLADVVQRFHLRS